MVNFIFIIITAIMLVITILGCSPKSDYLHFFFKLRIRILTCWLRNW